MSDRSTAKEKAARLLRKQGSVSSLTSGEQKATERSKPDKFDSISTISYLDEPNPDEIRPPIKYENTYQLQPNKKVPYGRIQNMIKDVLEGYLADEHYDANLCKQMTKTISDVIKARVKDMEIPRYKIICMVHIGQLLDQSMRVGSRCLWDPSCDTFAMHEFKNNSLYAVASVFGVYYE
ncbi:dynein light chain Tctex-type 5-B [Patella vulgata]|uniref:dynein light chain Tctex-type 5-B n=1 Tax=Patella vulgata TaxID=6465 RepID=UPI0021807ABA|nr:dynein light chain Tctex-type 5-B [Patella vulgata]